MKTIGQKIKELRRSKGLSQKDLADKLDVTSQAVSKWETDSSLPEMTMLPDIASIFGVQIDDLFEYSTEKRYESIGKKIEFGKLLTNAEFESEECFLMKEAEADPTNHDAVSLLADLYRYQGDCLKKKSYNHEDCNYIQNYQECNYYSNRVNWYIFITSCCSVIILGAYAGISH